MRLKLRLNDSQSFVAEQLERRCMFDALPILLHDIGPGQGSMIAEQIATIDDRALLASNVAGTGFQLWVTDGTPRGTQPFMLTGNINSNPVLLRRGEDHFVVVRPSGETAALWQTDGTMAGTIRICDAGDDGYGLGNTLFYYRTADPQALWVTDGKTHTYLMAFPPNSSFAYSLCIGDRYYTYSRDLGTQIFSLWTSDGTPEGTYSLGEFPRIESIQPVGGQLFFGTSDEQLRQQLWKTDGTRRGTKLITTIVGNGVSIWPTAAIGNTMFFRGSGQNGFELFRSDGTAEGTVRINAPGTNLTNPFNFVTAEGNLYFNAFDADTGTHAVWKLNASNGGSRSPVRISPNWETALRTRNFIDGYIYFSAHDNRHGQELWRSDGTPEGTELFSDIEVGPEGSDPLAVAKVGDRLIANAFTESTGYELFCFLGHASNNTVSITRLPPPAANRFSLLAWTVAQADDLEFD